jgi:hypothetical protein
MRVYIHGNCQGPAIANMVRGQFPDWNVFSYEVFAANILKEIEHYHELVKTADIIVSQPVHGPYRGRSDLSIEWIRAAAKPSAKLVVYPVMYFMGQLVSFQSVNLSGYGMEYHDMLLFHFVATGLRDDRISALLMNEDLYPAGFVQNEIALSINELRRREEADAIDVSLCPFLEEYGHTGPLFHVINHPCRPALAYMTKKILDYLGYCGDVPSEGEEPLPFPHVPLSPSAVRSLAQRNSYPSRWAVYDTERYHFPKMVIHRLEYHRRAARLLRKLNRDTMFRFLGEPHVRPFLSRLAHANPALPGILRWRDNP